MKNQGCGLNLGMSIGFIAKMCGDGYREDRIIQMLSNSWQIRS